ncbi:MAG TPA: ABC transporter substrate-binding protein [Candidatus Limnocylindria bacterium]|nr:ABC transporter substrate-binding protein [Candidatus Limnocylindria bacterium]
MADLPDITVGSDGFYESALVAEIYAQALEAKGFSVDRQLEIGARAARIAAFTSGEINLMPEYVGSGVLYLAENEGLEGEATSDTAETLAALQAQLAQLDPPAVAFEASPGTDADGFVVTQETADQFGLETMSDLAEVADQLTWGLPPECGDNPACGPGLLEVYGIDISTLEVNDYAACDVPMAEALNAGEIQVAELCTTQPAIETFNFVLLEDDKGLAPAQNIAPVATRELADAGGDLLADTLNAVSEKLTTEELTSLGVEVAVNQVSYADAAQAWLEDNGLI